VLTLYGNELAINHLILSEKINIGLADKLLDQVTTDQDQYDIETNNRLHLHSRHDTKPFSKVVFKAGEYNSIDPKIFINDTSAYGFVS
jgi:hypothetical protein